jgi:hypothetical protein
MIAHESWSEWTDRSVRGGAGVRAGRGGPPRRGTRRSDRCPDAGPLPPSASVWPPTARRCRRSNKLSARSNRRLAALSTRGWRSRAGPRRGSLSGCRRCRARRPPCWSNRRGVRTCSSYETRPGRRRQRAARVSGYALRAAGPVPDHHRPAGAAPGRGAIPARFRHHIEMSRGDPEAPSPTHQLGCHFLCRGLQPGQVPHDPYPAAVLGVVGQIAAAQPP